MFFPQYKSWLNSRKTAKNFCRSLHTGIVLKHLWSDSLVMKLKVTYTVETLTEAKPSGFSRIKVDNRYAPVAN
jgi:hypothetical protein